MRAFSSKAIELALFNLIKSAVSTSNFGFQTIERRALPPSAIEIFQQPALFLVPHGRTQSQGQAFGIMKRDPEFSVLIFARSGPEPQPDPPPQDLLNDALDAIDTALQGVPPGEPQTLGGLVRNVWIEGNILMGPGLVDQQCAILIPIRAVTGI